MGKIDQLNVRAFDGDGPALKKLRTRAISRLESVDTSQSPPCPAQFQRKKGRSRAPFHLGEYPAHLSRAVDRGRPELDHDGEPFLLETRQPLWAQLWVASGICQVTIDASTESSSAARPASVRSQERTVSDASQ